MKATIITIGDEILIGQIVDTNSASIARHLNAAGIVVARKRNRSATTATPSSPRSAAPWTAAT